MTERLKSTIVGLSYFNKKILVKGYHYYHSFQRRRLIAQLIGYTNSAGKYITPRSVPSSFLGTHPCSEYYGAYVFKWTNFLELTKIFKNFHYDFGTKHVAIRLVIEFNVSVAVMDKISNFPLNLTRKPQAHYFRV